MKKIIGVMPLLMLLGVLFLTNIIGVCLLVWGSISYWKISYVFCGVYLPNIHVSDMFRIAAVLFLPIIFLVISYVVGKNLAEKLMQKKKDINQNLINKKFTYLPIIVTLFLCIYIFGKLFFYLNVSDAMAWLNNNRFYAMRNVVMNFLSFSDFVIIYSILPMMIGMSYSREKKHRLLIFGLQLIAYVIVNIYIFQKRPLIVGVLLIGTIVLLNELNLIEKWNVKKLIITGMGVVAAFYCLYTLGITLNTVDKNTEKEYLITTEKISNEEIKNIAGQPTKSSAPSDVNSTDNNEMNEKEDPIFRSFELEGADLRLSSFEFTQLMAVVGLLNRTSYATIVDIVVFPELVDYYNIDLGLDMIGIGNSPDENIVAARILYPKAENPGACPVPFYIALYTQGGILVSIFGSIIVGFCLGFFWILAISPRNTLNYAFGAWICVFAVMLAINSGRNALFASDGAIWPVFFLGCVAIYNYIYEKIKEKKI